MAEIISRPGDQTHYEPNDRVIRNLHLIDQIDTQAKVATDATRITALEVENADLKRRIEVLEARLLAAGVK